METKRLAKIRIGIGGWTFPPWRNSFYPPGLPHARELAYASAQLTSIEINGTFYRHQSPATFAAWRDETPEGFVFAVKAHRATTHSKDFAGAAPAIARFLDSGLAELGPKLGPILWQFPTTRRFDPAVCETFLDALPPTLGKRRLRHAIEARHESFADPQWIALLRRHKIACVIIDSDKQALRGDITAPFIYARLQRNDAATKEGYDSAALDTWAARLHAWSTGTPVTNLPLTAPENSPDPKPLDCFAYFIAGDKERAPDAARGFIQRLK